METEGTERSAGSYLSRRRVVAAMAGIGATVASGAAMAFASESTPTASPDSTGTDSADDSSDAMEETYQAFLTKMATQLSVADAATVDTAIRESLKALVDDAYAAGDIAKNAVDVLKSGIDEATVPIALPIGGAGEFGFAFGADVGGKAGPVLHQVPMGGDGPVGCPVIPARTPDDDSATPSA